MEYSFYQSFIFLAHFLAHGFYFISVGSILSHLYCLVRLLNNKLMEPFSTKYWYREFVYCSGTDKIWREKMDQQEQFVSQIIFEFWENVKYQIKLLSKSIALGVRCDLLLYSFILLCFFPHSLLNYSSFDTKDAFRIHWLWSDTASQNIKFSLSHFNDIFKRCSREYAHGMSLIMNWILLIIHDLRIYLKKLLHAIILHLNSQYFVEHSQASLSFEGNVKMLMWYPH